MDSARSIFLALRPVKTNNLARVYVCFITEMLHSIVLVLEIKKAIIQIAFLESLLSVGFKEECDAVNCIAQFILPGEEYQPEMLRIWHIKTTALYDQYFLLK